VVPVTRNGDTGQGQQTEGRHTGGQRDADTDTIVAEVATALLDGTEPGTIQGELVDALAGTGLYGGVWVGNRLDRTATRAAGADPLVEVLGEIATLPTDADGFVTADSVTIVPAPVVQAVAADRGIEVTGIRAARIPLRHRGLACGMVVVATDRSGAFESTEIAALADIGRLGGFALDSAVHRRLLAADGAIEAVLETRHTSTPTVMTRLARSTEATVELDRVIPRDDSAHFHLTVPVSDIEASQLEDSDLIRRVSVRDCEGGECLVEAVVSTQCPLASLAVSGVAIVSATADGDHLRATVRAGETGPEILRAFRNRFPKVRCIAKRQAIDGDDDANAAGILDQAGLTRKQRTVLESALAGGFFKRPRERTGAEIAASLDISASTFHQHLREALRKVIETAVDPPT
jgi:predicted DNA binding protein